MLSNPPYGKSWKKDLETMGGKDAIRDPRFKVMNGEEELSLVTRSSDGQMLFLANMVSKMNHETPLGSRIAEVHNGSSLFTGDAGQGESNIRRWLIENDWLEVIVGTPLNLFYNTGIATYIWVLSNRKPEPRRGKVQLIDATHWFKPLRQNLGKKNCELSPEDIQRICDTYLAFQETEQSKVFDNAAFGYWKVTVERPLRLHSQLSVKAIEGSASPPVTKIFAPQSTTISAKSSLKSFPALRPPWRNASPIGAMTRKRMSRRKTRPRRKACLKRRGRNSSTQRRGNAMADSSKPPASCVRNWGAICLKTTTSFATTLTTRSKGSVSSFQPPTSSSSSRRQLASRRGSASHRQGS